MAHIDGHPAGEFCWFELGTSDQTAAKSFYTGLFGWSVVDSAMGPDMVYTIFKLDGRDAAACYTLMPDMVKQGIPPHWMPYVATDSADASVSKAKELGGTVMNGPFDVMEHGRMAVMMDPSGAAFCAWEAKNNKGTGITGVPGTVCWADLNTKDIAKATAFYTGLFGWTFALGQDPGTGYLHISNGETMIGGVPSAEQRDPNVPPHWMLYFLVTDCDASVAKAKELGGSVMFGPISMENVGRMAFLTDPQGAAFALFQPGR